MPLHLYRRHYDKGRCWGGHKPNTQTYESDELRPKHKKCGCPIYASGRLGANPKFRKNTGRFTWAEAKAVAEDWERRALNPDPEPPPSGSRPPAPLPAPTGTDKPRKTIESAIADTIAEHETNESSWNTIRGYQTVTHKIHRFSSDVKGYVYLDQWEKQDVKQFRVWMGVKGRSLKTYTSLTKAFFELAVFNEWIAANPARTPAKRKNKAQRRADEAAERSPFSDEELTRMAAGCRQYARLAESDQRYQFTGEDLEDFIWISVYTGLRISDVATFHLSRMNEKGDVHVRALKNSKWVDTWIPDWLQNRIRERAQKFGPYIFGFRPGSRGRTLEEETAGFAGAWRDRLNALWELCGPWTEPPTPHRFRHTFVRILLQDHVPLPIIAKLAGDTEEVIRESYSKWVPEHQDGVRNTLRDAFQGRPRLFVVK
jgi:integrase